mmetsp:Transcript_18364/g.38389  ORF Transcript_18364/g.38389 Transcript_18364/m.38389 type:complete len:192 (+) Transcript_18364:938-1513(+)
MFDGREHYTLSAPHVINLFSFSKAYGMMGWRVGYLAYHTGSENADILSQIIKVQDTIPICPPQLSQRLAVAALGAGKSWVTDQVSKLDGNRQLVRRALADSLGDDCVFGGEGAIYLWAKLPTSASRDWDVAAWLVQNHGVTLIPGSSCGSPGFIRAAFANISPIACEQAAYRLHHGLSLLASQAISFPSNH